jgi:Fe2+ or Zn2+ uptake regulation protein
MHHARATLKEQGYRLTPQRTAVWEALRGAGGHMTA